jgi:putative transposase
MIKKLRKNLRLKHYDYQSNGGYFISICTNFKKPLIQIQEKLIIEYVLHDLVKRFKGLTIDYYVIMSNHIHMILLLEQASVSLSKIIQAFKSLTTLHLKKQGYNANAFWQRNYYEHVIRNEKSLRQIREYIQNNPEAEKIKLMNRSGRTCSEQKLQQIHRGPQVFRSGRTCSEQKLQQIHRRPQVFRSGRACSANRARHDELCVEQARPLYKK